MLSCGVATSISDIKDNFTIDQVYLMYEKCVKEELDKRKLEAIIIANATSYSSPAYSKEGARSKQKMWQKFIDSLDWNRLVSIRKKQSPENVEKVFKGLKVIPIAKGKKGDGK